MHIERLGPFCHIWHKVLYHLAWFIGMQLHKFHQDVILLLAKAALLNTSDFIEHWSTCPAILSGVWKCLLASTFGQAQRDTMKLQYEWRDLTLRAVT